MSRGLLVTGASGMLGLELCRAAQADWEVYRFSRAQLDITDADGVAEVLDRVTPGVVINCAAWTDVDGAESDPDGAYAVNATGAGVLARACSAAGVRLVSVSTDYVFAGDGQRPYVESDGTDPQGVYGASKLAGEQQIVAAGEQHAIVRTAWLFGAGGRNFVDTMLRLADEGRQEVSVVTDQLGCPTWTGHLALGLLGVAESGAGGVLHGAASGHCTWNELAVEVFALAGLDVVVLPSSSDQQARAAKRPAFSVLGRERAGSPVLPDWRQGVRAYLGQCGRLAGGARAGQSIGGLS